MTAAAMAAISEPCGADVTLLSCDGKHLQAHAFILRMYSDMLGELLDVAQDGDGDDGGGCSGGSITLQLTDSGTSLELLRGMMYPAPWRADISLQNVDTIVALADKYHCPDIASRAEHFLLQTALPFMHHAPEPVGDAQAADACRRVLDWLALARHMDRPALAQGCLDLLGAKFFSFRVQSHMSHGALAGADSATLVQLLKCVDQQLPPRCHAHTHSARAATMAQQQPAAPPPAPHTLAQPRHEGFAAQAAAPYANLWQLMRAAGPQPFAAAGV